MEKLSVAVAVSVVLHVAVVSAALVYEPSKDDDPHLLGTPIAIEIVPAAAASPIVPDRLELAMLDDQSVLATITEATSAPHAAAIATGTTHVPGTPEITPPGTIPTARNPLFDMRAIRPAIANLAVRPAFRDNLEHAPEGTNPEHEVEQTGQLQPSGRGTFRSNQGVFTMRVGQDGSAKIKDAKNFNIHFIPDPRKLAKLPKMIGKGLSDWYGEDDKTPRDPEREAINNHRPVDKDTKPDSGGTVPILGGGFDVSDALMRRHGQDPYASKKLKVLDATRDERVQIGNKYKKAQLRQSTELMQRNIDALWAHTQDAAARKQGLFELWDDCAESGDASLVEGGRAARTLVLGVIRARFPAGSATAFTASEIAALDHKRASKAHFAPYE